MESELDLHDEIQKMHILATVPEHYNIAIQFHAANTLLGLLSHENSGKFIGHNVILSVLLNIVHSALHWCWRNYSYLKSALWQMWITFHKPRNQQLTFFPSKDLKMWCLYLCKDPASPGSPLLRVFHEGVHCFPHKFSCLNYEEQ